MISNFSGWKSDTEWLAAQEEIKQKHAQALKAFHEREAEGRKLSLRWQLTLWFCLFFFGVLAVCWALGWLLDKAGM